MLKNITLSAEESLIQNARHKAENQHTTLNSQFRLWLKDYISDKSQKENYQTLMHSLEYVTTNRSFTKDELNER